MVKVFEATLRKGVEVAWPEYPLYNDMSAYMILNDYPSKEELEFFSIHPNLFFHG